MSGENAPGQQTSEGEAGPREPGWARSPVGHFLFVCFRSARHRVRLWRFRRTGLARIHSINTDLKAEGDGQRVDVVSVAFNNPEVIGHQIRLIGKHLKDPHTLIIADNSSDAAARRAIAELCRQNGLPYLGLPRNPFLAVRGSMSHGISMNWVWRHYLRQRNARYFGFIDHDIYPIRATQLISRIEPSGMYGHLQQRDERWYLWAGFCFFRRDVFAGFPPNFLPWQVRETGAWLDTGGSLWEALYAKTDRRRVSFPEHQLGKLREGECTQSDVYETIGDWLHTFNASYWFAVQPKEQIIAELLKEY